MRGCGKEGLGPDRIGLEGRISRGKATKGADRRKTHAWVWAERVRGWRISSRQKVNQRDPRQENNLWLQGALNSAIRLLIHEFGHQYSGDHLSEDYHKALCWLGAGLERLALEKSNEFRRFMTK